jgi:hypothetical protein
MCPDYLPQITQGAILETPWKTSMAALVAEKPLFEPIMKYKFVFAVVTTLKCVRFET